MFRDRRHAGEILAAALERFRTQSDLLVLGLPRGGVMLARVVAEALAAELDVCLVRKVGVPTQPELAMGAVAEGGVRVLDQKLVRWTNLSPERLEALVAAAEGEIRRRRQMYHGGHVAEVDGRVVIVVDDGLATGSTMLAAVRALRERQAGRIVVAVPVGSRQAAELLAGEADEVVCLETPDPFGAVGAWYEVFDQTTDEEVRQALRPS